MEYILVILVLVIIGFLNRKNIFLWLALANVISGVNGFLNDNIGTGVFALAFSVALVWWHFYRKKYLEK